MNTTLVFLMVMLENLLFPQEYWKCKVLEECSIIVV